jgi:hypothetical protein
MTPALKIIPRKGKQDKKIVLFWNTNCWQDYTKITQKLKNPLRRKG